MSERSIVMGHKIRGTVLAVIGVMGVLLVFGVLSRPLQTKAHGLLAGGFVTSLPSKVA